MTTTEALQRTEAKIAKCEAICRATTVRHAGTDRYRREYITGLKELRNQLIRELCR